MPFINIDPTTPAGNEKIKFGDDRIREFKAQTIDNFKEVSNYPAATKPALRTAVWTTAQRPAGAELVDRVSGYNTDLGGPEIYDVANSVWNPALGLIEWATTSRPTKPFKGMIGFCTDLWVVERWSGSAWQRVSGGQRGDIKMWSGSVADISTKNIGWVLADGRSVTIDGATFTVPDLRNRFIVGAGQDGGTYTPGKDATAGTGNYAPGATGGEDKHTLTVPELANHNHNLQVRFVLSGGPNSSSLWHAENSGLAGAGSTDKDGGPTTNPITSSGSNNAHENRPPYYALCFLFKL